ncbi:MAG: cysteine synthase family protein [Nitrososphaerales archaeon]
MEVGNTPLVGLGNIYAKLECINPTGSIKDRMVKFIIDESEKRGLLRKGMTIVEATSGNTGIALSYYAKQKGYDAIIIMPDNVTEERKELVRRFGAKLVLCSSEGSFPEAVRIRDEMAKDEHYFSTDQFSSKLNVECHYRTTGKEIIQQLRERSLVADAFVAGVGTGGTLIGVAKALREVNPNVHIAVVEPAESPVMSGGAVGLHGIPGIGDGFIPEIVKSENGGLNPMINELISIRSSDAMEASISIAKNYGYCVGVSSGANYLAAKELSHSYDSVVTILPDGFTRYLSVGLSSSGKCNYNSEACRRSAAWLSQPEADTPPPPPKTA